MSGSGLDSFQVEPQKDSEESSTATANKLAELQKRIPDAATSEGEKQKHLNLLHAYNDFKDATQIVLGALANLEGVTIKAMHKKYNLPESD